MKKHFSWGLLSISLGLVSFGFSGMPVSAAVVKAKAPVKKVVTKKKNSKCPGLYCYVPVMKELAKPVSFCLTPAMKALRQKMTKQMEADITKAGAGYDAAVKKYKEGMDLSWAGMEEPYCGYGTFGVSASRKSYEKSVANVRNTFLKAAKVKDKIIDKVEGAEESKK